VTTLFAAVAIGERFSISLAIPEQFGSEDPTCFRQLIHG
jgi:hypothetical protein